MNKDNELNEILSSIKSGEEKTYDEIKLPEIKENKKEELEPPKPSNRGGEDELIWIEPEKEKNVSAKQIKKNFKERFVPKLKKTAGALFTKAFLMKVIIALVIIGAVFGSIKLVQFAKVAYLKPYEQKYKIEYPVGIKKEYCDFYGKNPTLAGVVEIEDTSTKENVYSSPKDDGVLFEKGSDITVDQHFRAIALDSEKCNLEKYYSNAKAYVKSSQRIKFTDIFGESEEYKVVSAFYTNTNPKDDNGYVFPYNLYGNLTKEDFPQYQDRINTRSLYNTGYEIEYDDYCLTLSTDSDIMKDFRFVVVAVKVDGKFEKTLKTSENKAIHYPQAYCDKIRIHNKYHLAGKWYPEIFTDSKKESTTRLSINNFN